MPLVFETVPIGILLQPLKTLFSGGRTLSVLMKDQVNSMLYGRPTLSTRTLFQLTAVLLFLVLCSVPSFAAGNSGPAPQLVPFTMGLLAGNAKTSLTGYSGDGGLGTAATLNAPGVLAVDSVGNVYFPDRGNAAIREINSQTGIITTIGGVGKIVSSGCADGVAALGNPIGSTSIWGIAVDGYGNVYFSDTTTRTISVIYRGGANVASFIKLENPTAVASAGGVLPGYVYHIAGTINLSSCAGTATANASASGPAVPSGDGSLAFQSATLGTAGPLALDNAGNLYIADSNPEGTIRVINTQPTTQTFYQYKVAPGAIQSIVNCSSFTITCPAGYGSSPVTTTNTGLGGPANVGVFNTLANQKGQYMNVDAYGNIYELNTTPATPAIALGVAYAGGVGNLMTDMLNTSLAGDTYVAGANALTAQAGDFYYLMVGGNILRPSSIVADPFGNLYYQDNHYAEVYRVDVNATYSSASLLEFAPVPGMFATGKNNPPTGAVPLPFCYPINVNTTYPGLAGYQSTDQWGDGCPAPYADGPGDTKNVNGYGSTVTDGQGNLYIADQSHNLIRKVTMGNNFPATPVGRALNPVTLVGQQELQVHFDGKNLPVPENAIPSIFTTNAFSISSASSDFTINPISSNFITSNAAGPLSGIIIGPATNLFTQQVSTGITSHPICGNTTGQVDSSIDCVVNVIFSPTAPGLRQAQLSAKTANGSVYSFGLTGVGTGPQLAVDGGTAVPVSLSGVANPAQIAFGADGTLYVADPSNNRVVASKNGTQTTVGSNLSSPMGVAVDAAGNVFIADTGNNRIVEVSINTGAQTTMGQIIEGCTAATSGSGPCTPTYPSYAFKAPQALAVDTHGNVYVADTGNAKIVEIPAHPTLGAAIPLLQFTGAPTFTNPVGIAVDAAGNIYVADTGAIQIIELPPGGGDFQNLPGATFSNYGSPAIHGSVFTQPSAVAVDAAGNLYVSDSGVNQVFEIPNSTGANAGAVTLNLPNVNLTGSAPANSAFAGGSLALDANGNLYVANSGGGQVLFANRNNPTLDFGQLAENDPALTAILTVSNIGNAPLNLTAPITQLQSGSSNSFTITSTTCSAGALPPGQHCTISAQYVASAVGSQSAAVAVNGGGTMLNLVGTGLPPKVNIMLAVTAPAGGAAQGQPATVTATLFQPNGSATPSGSVLFSYTLNGTAQGSGIAVPISGGQASFTLPTLLRGRKYMVSAIYQGDALDSQTSATPLTIYIPGIPVNAVANSVTFTYGTNVPTITGTVAGILPADQGVVTYKFVTNATKATPVGVYPINVIFSGGEYLDYGFPTVLTPAGAPATATETPAALTVQANDATTVYGGINPTPDLNLTSTFTGIVNGDGFAVNYTPPSTSIVNVGIVPIIPSVLGTKAGDYVINTKNGKLTVTQQTPSLTVSNTFATILPTALSTDPLTVSVSNPVGKGVPSGTITLTDTFTPLISSAPGIGTAAAPVTIGPLPLVAGTISYTITSTTPGIHSFSATYNGDNNFKSVSSTSNVTIEVDTSDFIVTSTTNPIQIAPGVIPGGNNSIAGESAATPEQAVVTVTSVQGAAAATIYLGCQPQNPRYVNCSLSPAAVTLPAPTTGSTSSNAQSILSISTQATLPLGFFSSETHRPASTTVLAFVPFGVLAFCFRRRRSLSKALWMLAAIATISVGLNGCGSTTVPFYTPVPAGPQSVTIYACSVQASCTTSSSVDSPLTGTGAGVIRSFTVPINIQ
jgi:sugar lactone lactonase YvrE